MTSVPCFWRSFVIDLLKHVAFAARLREGKGFPAPPLPDTRSVSNLMFVGFIKVFLLLNFVHIRGREQGKRHLKCKMWLKWVNAECGIHVRCKKNYLEPYGKEFCGDIEFNTCESQLVRTSCAILAQLWFLVWIQKWLEILILFFFITWKNNYWWFTYFWINLTFWKKAKGEMF